ncbi:MAG: universal stress protein [Desulfobacula sp.]|uniref:universal stress protein n=1 Tax=Desulfobacula sp. TaxID=2593537 RepID=UPI0025C3488A|nr:universal stress protein [Desulfobacula sp.]MCD4721986.1 universal stress protein [Desulfobacula sp.]
MEKIEKILACVDFSKYSLMTLEYAVELAKGTQTQIILFNVINQRDINSVEKVSKYFPQKVTVEGYIKELKKDRNKEMKAIIKENFFNEKSMMSIKIDTGVPFESILKAVETENIDLIVMANKGRGNVARVLFGSAAEKVFRHSPVPVVSVRDKNIFKRGNKNGRK